MQAETEKVAESTEEGAHEWEVTAEDERLGFGGGPETGADVTPYVMMAISNTKSCKRKCFSGMGVSGCHLTCNILRIDTIQGDDST